MKRTTFVLCGLTILCTLCILSFDLRSPNTAEQIPNKQVPAITPSPKEELRAQFAAPLKGRSLKELCRLSDKLNQILDNTSQSVEIRTHLIEDIGGGRWSAEAITARISQPDEWYPNGGYIFFALQDTILIDYWSEGLYDYYDIHGADTIWHIDIEAMNSYREAHPELFLLKDIRTEADSLTRVAPRLYSPDMHYAASISYIINPDIEAGIKAGYYNLEGECRFKSGIALQDCTTGQITKLYDEVCQNGLNIEQLAWGLNSDVLYFTNGNETASSYGVYEYNLNSRKTESIASGFLNRVIPTGEYKGYLEIITGYYAQQGGHYWYKAALSPDQKTKIQLSEPTMDITTIN